MTVLRNAKSPSACDRLDARVGSGTNSTLKHWDAGTDGCGFEPPLFSAVSSRSIMLVTVEYGEPSRVAGTDTETDGNWLVGSSDGRTEKGVPCDPDSSTSIGLCCSAP